VDAKENVSSGQKSTRFVERISLQPADNLAEFVHRVLQLSQNLLGLGLSMTISHAHMPPNDAPEAQG